MPTSQARRPRDRKQQLLAAATERFCASGYHNVGMNEIADAVGITGAAVYRHFRGKQDLLLAAAQVGVDQYAAVFLQDYGNLDEMLAAIGAEALRQRAAVVLWEREVLHLPAEVLRELRACYRRAVSPVRAAVGAARPELAADDVDLLLWAVLAVFASPGYHSVELAPHRLLDRLVEAGRAVCHTTAVPHRAAPPSTAAPATSPARLLPVSRREAVLTAATRLFRNHGYRAVGMDEIGAAAGITGASVYHHFSSKSAILMTALTRCLEALLFDLSGALATAASAGEALDLVLRSYVRASLVHGDVMGALQKELINLPVDERRAIRKAQHEYVTEWAALLVGHRPDLPEPEAQVLVRASLTVVNSCLGIRHLRKRPELGQELVALGRTVLGLNAPEGAP